MANVPYEMWAGYYRLLLTQMEHDPQTLLDVCCGTGILSELLTKSGYRVTGFDLSPEMIDIACRKAVEAGLDIDYFVADATEFEIGKTFDGAFSFFDSLNYITTLEGFRSAVRQVGKHLVPGGSFVFDLNTSFAFEQRMFDQEDLRKRSLIRYQWKGDYNPAERIIRVEMDFWREGETFHEVHVQRAHSMDEVVDALESAGFESIRFFDSYTLSPPRKRSDRWHVVARRR